MHDVIIIGAGPAGLAAALYAAKKRLDFLVVSRDLGGKSNYKVELPDTESNETIRADELVTIYRTRLEYLRHFYTLTGVSSLAEIDGGFAVELEQGGTETARAVIIASGTHIRRLEAPGEMEFLSRALGYSSISYSHLFAKKRVFIAGDSDRVLTSAIELSIHAEEVHVALLSGGSFRSALVDRAASLDRVHLYRGAEVRRFTGEGYASSVVVATADGEQEIAADGFFVEPEPVPNTSFVPDEVERLATGAIRVDGANMTNVPGLFAAGDVTGNGYEQILIALGEGAKAALAAYGYLIEHGLEGR